MHSFVNVGEVVDGKYRIDEILGSGGMSVVARAFHLKLGQDVALKALRRPESHLEDAVQRFRREAQMLARIKSEHVVRIFDFGTMPDGSPYLVMEYLVGNDLRDELIRRGPLDVEEAASTLLEALEGVAETHARNVVHRDLKPQNLFLAQSPHGTRSLKVLDYGVSKFVTPSTSTDLSVTQTSWFIGSPSYMSPEQMRSARSVDHRTDIWSLGAILYEMVSGRVPYLADTVPDLCALLFDSTPLSIGHLCPNLPREFCAVIERCLEKDRELRYANVGELAQALAPFATASLVNAERVDRVVCRCAAKVPAGVGSTPPPPSAPYERPLSSLGTSSLSPSALSSRPSGGNTHSGWKRMGRAVSKHSGGTLVSLGVVALTAAFTLSLKGGGQEQTLAASTVVPASALTAPRTNAVAGMTLGSAHVGGTETTGLQVEESPGVGASAAAGPELSIPTRATGAPGSARRALRAQVGSREFIATKAPGGGSEAVLASPPEPKVEPPPRRLDAWDPASFGGRH